MIYSYFVVAGSDRASLFIDKVNERVFQFSAIKCLFYKHPLNDVFLVDATMNRKKIEDLIEDFEVINYQEAIERGWYLGTYRGTFGREREKLEDIQLLYDGIVANYGQPNFPVSRALIFGLLSACYSLRISLEKKISAINSNKLNNWWKERSLELKQKKGLLFEFELYMHAEKHGGPLNKVRSNIDIYATSLSTGLIFPVYPVNKNISPLHISPEGAYVISDEGTIRERRHQVPVGIAGGIYEIKIHSARLTHIGRDITGLSFLDMITLIKCYYEELLFEAEYINEDRKANKHGLWPLVEKI